MKINVIFTGGTIGSQIGEDGQIHPKQNPYRLINDFKILDKEFENIEFVCQEPYRILSENLDADHLNQLFLSVNAIMNNHENTQGIIITHGTDTLQYTASFLNYLFSDCSLPIILVSSAYVLSDARANGVINFAGAVKYIMSENRKGGVYVSYANEGETLAKIYPAAEILGHEIYESDIHIVRKSISLKEKEADLSEEQLLQQAELIKHTEIKQVELGKYLKQKLANNEKILNENSPVLWLKNYVGMRYPKGFDLADYKAVLLESYHSGTICISKELKEFVANAKTNQIEVYICGLAEEGAEYETVEEYRKLGVKILPQRSIISQYCKLWLAYDNDFDVDSYMNMQIGNE